MTKFYLDRPASDVLCAYNETPWARSVTLTMTPSVTA